MKTTKRYEAIRKVAVENKELHELKAHTSAQVMAKVEKIDHYMIGEIVKKHVNLMIGELIDNCFINIQLVNKLKDMIGDGIDMTMAKMKMAYAIEESIKRHKQHAKIAAGLDFDELGPVIAGKVTRENWLKFMDQTIDSCMPGADGKDLIDPFTGLSDEEQAELDEMAQEAWGETDAFDHDEELGYIMNQDSDEADENDSDIPF